MNELTKDQWEKSMSTGFGDGDHPINHDNPHHDTLVVKLENAEMSMSDMTKTIEYSDKLQKMFNVNDDLEDWVKAKLNHAADYIATVRDYLKFYHDEKSLGISDQEINERWTRKYKAGIDCSHPKGFSQRAHCAGRRARRAGRRTKSSSVSEVEIYNEVLKDLIEDILQEESSMAMGALKQINSDAQELQSMLKPQMELPDWCKAKLNLAGEYLDDVYHHLDHFGPEGRKFDENINELDYEGAVGFHEFMAFYKDASPEQLQQMEKYLANGDTDSIKDLIHQVTGMTMHNVKEAVIDPRFLAMQQMSRPELEHYILYTQQKKPSYVSPVIQKAYWISPIGELTPVSDHERWAKEMYPDAKDPKMEAFRNGYIRMVYSVLKNGRVQFDFQNIKTPSGGEDFNKNGNSTLGIPPVKPNVMVVIHQFIKEKNKLTNTVDDGNLEEVMSIEEDWKKMLGTTALAAATMFGTPDVQAATKAKVKRPVAVKQVVKPTSSKFDTMSVFNKYAAIHPDYPKFLNALHQVESSGQITGDKAIIGDNGKARGPLQIHKEYWQDVKNVVGGKYEDVDNLDYAAKVVTAYMLKYAKNSLQNGDFAVSARRHNGGPTGDRKSATLDYARKVMNNMPSEYVMVKKENVNGTTTV